MMSKLTTLYFRVKEKLFKTSQVDRDAYLRDIYACGNYPRVLSISETLERAEKEKLSIARYGDGEFSLCLGQDISFQKSNPALQKKLVEILECRNPRCLVCIPEFIPDKFTPFWVDYWFENIRFLLPLFDKNYVYGNPGCTRTSSMDDCDTFKRIFSHRKILVITGKSSRFVAVPELFEKSLKLEFIYTKAVDAWAEYDDIKKKAMAYSRDWLILPSLGPTATVLAYELSECGFQAIDIGHFPNIYMYRKGLSVKPEDLPVSRE